ncbi:MAG: cellulose binding domain-containing protein [Oligoflexales bacterium]|nr:cellulose binding domain-containing protein [Oligoflexales bacterium]
MSLKNSPVSDKITFQGILPSAFFLFFFIFFAISCDALNTKNNKKSDSGSDNKEQASVSKTEKEAEQPSGTTTDGLAKDESNTVASQAASGSGSSVDSSKEDTSGTDQKKSAESSSNKTDSSGNTLGQKAETKEKAQKDEDKEEEKAPPSTSSDASAFSVATSWKTGFQANIKLDQKKNWRVTFDLPYRITWCWNAELKRTAGSGGGFHYEMTPPKYETDVIGFVADGDGSNPPSNFLIEYNSF